MNNPFDYDRPTRTHRVVVTFEMEEMNGTPEESAAVLLDLYVADEVTVLSVDATEADAQYPVLVYRYPDMTDEQAKAIQDFVVQVQEVVA